MKLFKFSFLVLFAALFTLNSCVDDDFDAPPVGGESPNLTATTSIKELKAMHTLGALEEITDDLIIRGIVVADDRSGNFFRQLILQDSSAGIELRIDETDLFNEYPIGREVFVRCKGLWLGDYNGVTQLGGGTNLDDGELELARIPSALIDQYLVKGTWGNDIAPKVTTINELGEDDINTLIQLNDMQFSLLTCQRTFAIDYISSQGVRVRQSLNQEIESCVGGGNAVVRSSGFSSFASEMLPTGSGSIQAIYTVFGSTKQLILRNPAEIDMPNSRCGNTGAAGDLRTIESVRNMFTGSPMTITEDIKISGIVISDLANENVSNRNIVLQDGASGIVVRFTDSHAFGLNEIVDVNIKGAELSEYNGLLQVNNVELTASFTTCETGEPTIRSASVQEILDNANTWESTLVKIDNATISGGSTYGGSTTVSDGTNAIPMFTQSFATFANQFLPTGEVTLTAIIGDFNGVQLNMRNLDDVEGGIVEEPTITSLQDIKGLFNGSAVNIPNNFAVKGVVISDGGSGNITSRNLVLQDGEAGIVVRFAEDHNFALGTELTITVRGVELSEYRTLLQLNNVPLANVTAQSAGTLPTPRVATVNEILSNGEAWESTLVQVNGATISGSATFNGNTMVSDGTGSIAMYTRGDAAFSGTSVPSNPVKLTAIVSEFDGTRQLSMRRGSDVE